MHNDLLTIGKFTIHGYGLMIGIGFAAAYLVTEYRARKRGMDTDMVYILFFSSIIFGLLGAKLCYYLTILDELLKDFSLLLSEGFVVYGGIIGGVLAGYVACRIKKQDFWKYFDLVAPAIALAQGFGRIGCLLAGCCYGRETTSALSITFQNSDFAPNGVALIPTQIYSSLLDFLNFAVLCLIARHVKKIRSWPGATWCSTASAGLSWNSSGEIWSVGAWGLLVHPSLSPSLYWRQGFFCWPGEGGKEHGAVHRKIRLK